MKNKLGLSLIIAIIIVYAWGIISDAAVNDIASGITRLHILANSNSDEDQALKLRIRNRILNEVRLNQIDKNNLSEIKQVCEDELKRCSCDYSIEIETGTYFFPTKEYKNINLPAGNYNAVKIIIGNGEGRNWWCVMYPPLCFTDESLGEMYNEELEILENSMDEYSYKIISSNDITITPAFKIIELWQEFKNHTF